MATVVWFIIEKDSIVVESKSGQKFLLSLCQLAHATNMLNTAQQTVFDLLLLHSIARAHICIKNSWKTFQKFRVPALSQLLALPRIICVKFICYLGSCRNLWIK